MKIIDPNKKKNLYKVCLPRATFYFQIIGEEEGDGIWPCSLLVISRDSRAYTADLPHYTFEEYERNGKVEIITNQAEYAKFLLSEKISIAHR